MKARLQDTSFEGNVGMVHRIARWGLALYQNNGIAVEYDDLFQNCAMSLMHAQRNFDPAKGAFSTYVFNTAMGHMRTDVRRRLKERTAIGLFSVEDYRIGADSDGDGEISLYDTVAADQETVDERMERMEQIERRYDTLSPRAKQIIDAITNPDADLLAEFDAAQAFEDQAKALGVDPGKRAPNCLTVGFVGRYFGLEKEQIAAIRKELAKTYRLKAAEIR